MTPQFSHDESVKNLLKAYPFEALEFLAPDFWQARGRPVGLEILETVVAKDDVAVSGPGQSMDLAMRLASIQPPSAATQPTANSLGIACV